jgi:PIN domain nuclease of toxin-antitoxin system
LTAVLLDTHVLAWGLSNSARIPELARNRIASADAIWVSAMSLYEIGQKVRIGKWPEMAPHLHELRGLVKAQGGRWRAADDAITSRAALLEWPHRDPFDRLIAATAIEIGVPLVSADALFDDLGPSPDWRGRIW